MNYKNSYRITMNRIIIITMPNNELQNNNASKNKNSRIRNVLTYEWFFPPAL